MTEVSTQIAPQDRQLAMLTHLSGLAGYAVPLGGIVVPIVIWVTKSENRTISAIAKQAIFLNVAVFVVLLALGLLTITIVLAPITIPLMIAFGLAALILPIVGAVKASDGEFYSYPVIGSHI